MKGRKFLGAQLALSAIFNFDPDHAQRFLVSSFELTFALLIILCLFIFLLVALLLELQECKFCLWDEFLCRKKIC